MYGHVLEDILYFSVLDIVLGMVDHITFAWKD